MCAPKVSTEKKDWVLKFQILSALYLLSCWLVVFIDMNTYILPESRTSKTFLEENYPIAFSSCYLFTKKNIEHGTEHDIDSVYGVNMH